MTEFVEVDTTAGRVRGFWREGSAAFLGIPFAEPPVGELRFAAPVPHAPWDGVRDALEYGATPQRGALAEITLIPEPSVPGDSTLNVNVFTPSPGEGALPVLVYIHGGGYVAGSPASPWYDGAAFNRDGIVTVSLSYRLGFDGFGRIPDAPSNRGVRDWLLGLEWVRDNIAAFGGDPARVTIAGQSAGGGAVLTLLGMPAAQNLFHAVWCISGALGDVTPERAEALAGRLATAAGVEPTRAGFASLTEDALLAAQAKVSGFAEGVNPLDAMAAMLDDGLALGPMIDGDLLPRPTIDAIRDGVGADRPLVLGTTDDEFTMALTPAKNKLRFIPPNVLLGRLGLRGGRRSAYRRANRGIHGTAAVIGRYVTDRMFRAPTLQVAEARGAAATWLYRFAWRSPVHGFAIHCLDVAFFFDCLQRDGVTAIAGAHPPEALATEVHGSAVRFVRDGAPGWPGFAQDGATRVFDEPPTTEQHGFAPVEALLR
ncbi:MAG: carboxylesterase family protein [Microbacteriaceae bacterium]|nr:carboxylesterase family protein [Microbacteriaceae bacterium]